MADDGGDATANKSSHRPPQETFHRIPAQETQVEHTFPNNTTGIIPLPPGSRGPKSLYLKRNGDSFGFTLRHFIVYPPDSIADNDGRHAAVGALSAPMDTIFVKHVKDRSPAKLAGLQCGDRLVGVNRIAVTDKSYAQVVQLIQNSPDYLHLLVVPKEDDILQRYFADTAYNPASNQQQQQLPELPGDRQAAQQFLTQTFNQLPGEFQVDAVSWRSLQNTYGYNDPKFPIYSRGQQRSVDNLDVNDRIYAVPQYFYTNEPTRRQRSRAQPQVPIYTKMGRRASDGCALSDREYPYEQSSGGVSSDYEDMVVNNSKMKTMYKMNNSDLRYPNNAGCRLSLDGGRRESNSSLNSSLVDGSKDSLNSFDSTSTLTGHETDDSAIMSRYRRSFQQKEEFLKMPPDANLIAREFYSRPKKLDKAMWPPNEPIRLDVMVAKPAAVKPTHQHFQRVKNDIEVERDLLAHSQNLNGGVPGVVNRQAVKTPKDKNSTVNLEKIKEASTAPECLDYMEQFNGSSAEDVYSEDKRKYPPVVQIVHKRARDFESGKALPEDDPLLSNRTSFYRSELARLSSKRVVPNVTERAQEFEVRSIEPKKDNSTSTVSTSTPLRKTPKDTRSLESPGSSKSSSGSPINEPLNHSKRLSGNVMISTGSKYIHCPPPSEYGKPTEMPENQTPMLRVRSNSADSWAAALQQDQKKSDSNNRRISRQDAIDDGNNTKDQLTMDDISDQIPYADIPPLIPEPVEHIHFTPSVSITPAPTIVRAIRPTQLDLEGPVRPSRHLKPPTSIVDTPIRRPISPAVSEDDNKPVVVKRRVKNTNLADDDRVMRRESYLKATEGGRMPFDSDLSDGDVSPQVLRSAHRRWRPPMFPGDIQQLRRLFEDAASSLGGSVSGNSSSSASLDREKHNASPLEKDRHSIIKEGPLHCKITEIDGKRFGDRSWKQVWALLKGPKLFLHKDKHHQSPMGTSDVVEQSLASGVDMRASVVRVAEDYTKRKHVLRVSSVNPCRSELLLQAENTEELADWVKALQEQMATTTDNEAKIDPLNGSKQQAVPQTIPASTTIQVQGSRLSPQPSKSSKSSSSGRSRSPTGQSPVSKTRKPSQVHEPSTSPKSKTWRGRVVKQFRKMHGASSPSSPTAPPEGSTFGIPLDQCLASSNNQYVPRFVEVCTNIVDARGLQTVGIYRVPGNNALITALTDEVNRNYDDVPIDDARWNDLHVVSSLLKSYFRKIPDSLVTNELYPNFIKADKIEDVEKRMKELKRLVKMLPLHNYHTLKHIIYHLRKVVANADVNKMEAKNLAIVFGPNLVRSEEDNMQNMVNNMTHQCKIVETLLTCADWFFAENDQEVPIPAVASDMHEECEAANTQILLLDNISKYEALKDKEKNGALFSSIISAAQRKVKRKTTKGSLNESKEEVSYPNETGQFLYSDLKNSTTSEDNKTSVIPTTVRDIEKTHKQPEKGPFFNYSTDQEDFHRRVEHFRQETEAMLQMPRHLEISVNNIATTNKSANLSSSASNVNQNTRLSLKPNDAHLLKTHSASNVFSRTVKTDNSRNSLNSIDNNSYAMHYANKNNSDYFPYGGGKAKYSELVDSNRNAESGGYQMLNKGALLDTGDKRNGRFALRRGSSVENLNSSSMELSSNGTKKKVKYENENELNQRTGSLDSINKAVSLEDETDLVTSLTKLYDKKLMEKKNLQGNLLAGEGLPYVDESPEKVSRDIITSHSDKENLPSLNELYRNPSLHKSKFANNNNPKSSYNQWEDIIFKESKNDIEKDEDSMENVPDNERHISTTHNKLTLFGNNTNKIAPLSADANSKLRRSESLNKPERTVSPLNIKLKRSESLNKTGDKLKRSDSLTKNEKTESNLNKRRELATSVRRSKDLIKLKRKNGMPDRSIKRRHTVGGTKDPDKVTWLDNKYHEEVSCNKENKEKNLRTSSPDLSSTRRERLFFEINLIGPENMVMALKQHLMGARPQSFPDTAVFKVPLESHV